GDNRADEQHCREQHEQPYPGPREVPQEQLALVVTLQMLLERLGGGAEPGMVGVVHLDALAAAEQRIEHGPLAGRQAAAAVGPEEGGLRASETEERLLALDQLELAVGAAFDDRRSEAAVVEAHSSDVAHPRSGHSFRRGEQWHDRARTRAAPGLLPRHEI